MKSKVVLDFGFGFCWKNPPRKHILRSVGVKYAKGNFINQTLGF